MSRDTKLKVHATIDGSGVVQSCSHVKCSRVSRTPPGSCFYTTSAQAAPKLYEDLRLMTPASPSPWTVPAVPSRIIWVICSSMLVNHHTWWNTLTDHSRRAWILHLSCDVRMTCSITIVTLHESWIANTIVGCDDLVHCQ